jgi:hypothetical protein
MKTSACTRELCGPAHCIYVKEETYKRKLTHFPFEDTGAVYNCTPSDWKVPASKFKPQTSIPHRCCLWFSSVAAHKCHYVTLIMPRSPPSISFTIHCHPTIRLYACILYSKQRNASFSKHEVHQFS